MTFGGPLSLPCEVFIRTQGTSISITPPTPEPYSLGQNSKLNLLGFFFPSPEPHFTNEVKAEDKL